MTDRTIKVRLEAVTTGFASAMTKAKSDAKGLAGELQKASQTDSWRQTSTVMLGVGTAATVALGAAAKSTLDFDKRMSGVKATGIEAQAAFGALRQAAIDAGGATAFSATEAAEGMEALLKAGVSVNDVLSGGLAGSLDLAAAGQLDLATAAETAASAMTQFKLSGDQVPRIADALAAGAGKAQGDVTDLAQALGQSGLVASQFGLSLEETVGGLSAFASAGLMGSDSGTSLKTMLLALAKPSGQAAELMDQLGINAYDAQGQFVGLEGLAGQLQGALSGLSEEQRQSALATIFGTDAIRSASVLYEQGADGIAEWTAAVSDAGYAAEVAAIMQDNLAGDLEKLGGAFDTLMIQLGEGQNAPLRELTQGITGVVDAAASNHQGVAALGEGLVGVAGGALALGGAMKAASGITEFRSNLVELEKTAPKTAKALGAAAKGAGLLSVAIAGLTAAGQLREFFHDAPAAIDDVTASLVRAADSGELAGEAFDTITGGQILSGVESWSDAFKRVANDTDNWTTAVDNLDGMLSDLTNSASGIDRIREQFAAVDRELTTMDPGRAAAVFAEIAAEAEAAGRPVDELVALFPQYAGAIQLAAAESGKGKLSTEELAEAMGTIPDAATGATVATDDLTASATAFTDAAAEEAAALDEAMGALQEYYGAALSASDATIALEQSFDDAAAAAAENGKTLDLNTEAGRANQSALNDIARSALDAATAMAENGATADEVKGATQRARDEFIKAAQSMGATADEADALADKYGLIPSKVSTTITVKADLTGYYDANRVLNSIAGKTVSAYVAVKTYGQGAVATGGYGGDVAAAIGLAGGGMARRAFSQGSLVDGPGTTTSDSIAAWLSRKEFVTRAAAVDYYGTDVMYAMNAKRIPRQVFAQMGYADGGTPQHAYAPARLAGGGMAWAAPQGLATEPSLVQHNYGVDAAELAARNKAQWEHWRRNAAVVRR